MSWYDSRPLAWPWMGVPGGDGGDGLVEVVDFGGAHEVHAAAGCAGAADRDLRHGVAAGQEILQRERRGLARPVDRVIDDFAVGRVRADLVVWTCIHDDGHL